MPYTEIEARKSEVDRIRSRAKSFFERNHAEIQAMKKYPGIHPDVIRVREQRLYSNLCSWRDAIQKSKHLSREIKR